MIPGDLDLSWGAQVVAGSAAFALMGCVGALSVARAFKAGVTADAMRLGAAAIGAAAIALTRPEVHAVAAGRGSIDPARAALLGLAGCAGLSLLGFWLESVDRRLWAERERGAGPDPKFPKMTKLFPRRRRLWRLARLSLALGWAALAWVTRGVSGGASGSNRPYALAALAAAGAIGLVALVYGPGFRKALEKSLPEVESLESWARQAGQWALPCFGIYLASASYWSYEVLGSYWAWEPRLGLALLAAIYAAWWLCLKPGRKLSAAAGAACVLWAATWIAAHGGHGIVPPKL